MAAAVLAVRIESCVPEVELPGGTQSVENRLKTLLRGEGSVLDGPEETFESTLIHVRR